MTIQPAAPQADAQRKITRAAGFLFLFMVLALLVGVFYLLLTRTDQENLTQAKLFALIRDGRVVTLVEEIDPNNGIRTLTGVYKKVASDGLGTTEARAAFKVQIDLWLDPNLLNELKQAGYTGTIETVTKTDLVWPLVVNFLPIILFVGLMYWLLRQVRGRTGPS